MESISIPILMNFPLISVLMPYFGFTHQIFILLSSLSVGTRSKLIERYSEFRKFMLKYSKVIEVKIEDLYKKKLPLDVFILQIKTFPYPKAKDLKAFADTVFLFNSKIYKKTTNKIEFILYAHKQRRLIPW